MYTCLETPAYPEKVFGGKVKKILEFHKDCEMFVRIHFLIEEKKERLR